MFCFRKLVQKTGSDTFRRFCFRKLVRKTGSENWFGSGLRGRCKSSASQFKLELAYYIDTFTVTTTRTMSCAQTLEDLKATSIDTSKIAKTSDPVENCGRKTAMEGWKRNKHECEPVTTQSSKLKYQKMLIHARSHIGLPNAEKGKEMRKELYAYAPVMVSEFIEQTEAALDDSWHGPQAKQFIQRKLSEMHQSMAELCCLLAEDGEVGRGVNLPNQGLMKAEDIHNLGASHAQKALENRREGGEAEDPNAIGAILFWLAKNQLGGSKSIQPDRLFRMVQESKARMEELDLPEDHFRKKQIQALLASLDKELFDAFTVSNTSASCANEDDSCEDKPQTCLICLSRPMEMVFGCQHVCACESCSREITKCPICRVVIAERTRVYIA